MITKYETKTKKQEEKREREKQNLMSQSQNEWQQTIKPKPIPAFSLRKSEVEKQQHQMSIFSAAHCLSFGDPLKCMGLCQTNSNESWLFVVSQLLCVFLCVGRVCECISARASQKLFVANVLIMNVVFRMVVLHCHTFAEVVNKAQTMSLFL